MSEFQLVACQINLGGDRGSVIVRHRFNPVSFPEYLLLQVIHGGEEHVHHAMSCGYEWRDMDQEYQRLEETYGDELVRQVFPGPVHRLPLGNDNMLTVDEYEAGETAKNAAVAKVRAKAPRAKVQLPEGADQLPVA